MEGNVTSRSNNLTAANTTALGMECRRLARGRETILSAPAAADSVTVEVTQELRSWDRMKNSWQRLTICGLSIFFLVTPPGPPLLTQIIHPGPGKTYLGFDRNDYPGARNLAALRQAFSFSGYWLNVPPGAKTNTWIGKRKVVRNAGFGFLLLFNGRLDAELKKTRDPAALGRMDARTALASARREGFPKDTVIFLDQEEGGRMLPEQKAYLFAWVDGVNAGEFRAGIYCSGIAAAEQGGVTVITADDIRQNANGRPIVYWVTNDACPPSPGCTFPQKAPPPSGSGLTFAEVWQYAQSPKRPDVARACGTSYNHDGNCYPPGLSGQKFFVDVDAAGSDDPSAGR